MLDIKESSITPAQVHQLLDSVPEWFGRPESNQEYTQATQRLTNWLAFDGSTVCGLVSLEKHSAESWEVYLMVVDRNYHRQGIGRQLLEKVEASARVQGVKLLQVKTLGESHPDKFYALTRLFYINQGFIPLEETHLWGEDTPCLIMVKPL